MSQRNSGYERKERDCYETPAWVTQALLPHLRSNLMIWEPAAGSGKMVTALAVGGYRVAGTDIDSGRDFLTTTPVLANAIVTNPPYALATKFIERALQLMMPQGGMVAMLLRTDFDHAASRAHLFASHRAFAKKLVLTRRIKWFADSKGHPSFNHAWFIWDWRHRGAPTLTYGPAEYDAQKDFAGSLEVGYAAIRERMANGGPGWEPKA